MLAPVILLLMLGDVVGLNCRVRQRGGSPLGRIEQIGHIVEDKWFDPEALSRKINEAIEEATS